MCTFLQFLPKNQRCPSLATITEQLLWLGGSASAGLTLLRSRQPKENAASAAHDSHPVCKNRRKGRNAKGQNVTQRVCVRRKLRKSRRFLSTPVAAAAVGRRPDFLLNLNVAGCTEPICHQNNRRCGDLHDLSHRRLTGELIYCRAPP